MLIRKFLKPRPLTPPPPQTDTPPPPQTDTLPADAAASSPPLEDSDDDADLQPSPLKFTRKKESYQVIPEQGEPTGTAQTVGWDDTGLDNGIQVTAGVKQEDEADELLSANSWVPVIPTPSNASSSPEEEEDAITPAEMLAELSATTNVPMPCELDLSQISPKPVYVPEEQPDHLKHSTVKRQEKTALQRYEEEQEDAKEVIGKGNEKFISTMYDPEGIISARPDGQVILTDDTKGVIEIKTSKTSLPLQEALGGKEIKFLEPKPGSTEYWLKRKHDYYHQVQAEIYVGQDDEIAFCDFVTYLEENKDIFIERIKQDSEWRDRNVPRVREFCEIYNRLILQDDETTADTK